MMTAAIRSSQSFFFRPRSFSSSRVLRAWRVVRRSSWRTTGLPTAFSSQAAKTSVFSVRVPGAAVHAEGVPQDDLPDVVLGDEVPEILPVGRCPGR